MTEKMKRNLFYFILIFVTVEVSGQSKIESFPELNTFIIPEFKNSDNIFPVAVIHVSINSETYKIPVSYSLLHYSTDSNNFLIKGDNIDNYCFQVLNNGRCKPLFKKETLKLPPDWAIFLKKTRNNYDSVKTKLNLTNYLKFLPKPEWLQNDATPKDENGTYLKFICQIEMKDLTTDDCTLYIFFDKKRKIVRQIYQRD